MGGVIAKLQNSRQLRVLQRQPFRTVIAKFHLHACIAGATFKIQDHALAKFFMGHILADPERMIFITETRFEIGA